MANRKGADRTGIAFGSTIRDYRLKAQMDQEQVGRACGLTANTVSNWERGVSRPDLAVVPALCDVLGIPLEVFFGMPSTSTLTGTERHIVEDYRRMTAPNKVQLVKVIDAMMESQEETRRDGYRKNYKMCIRDSFQAFRCLLAVDFLDDAHQLIGHVVFSNVVSPTHACHLIMRIWMS